jgi:hypothetical protein
MTKKIKFEGKEEKRSMGSYFEIIPCINAVK